MRALPWAAPRGWESLQAALWQALREPLGDVGGAVCIWERLERFTLKARTGHPVHTASQMQNPEVGTYMLGSPIRCELHEAVSVRFPSQCRARYLPCAQEMICPVTGGVFPVAYVVDPAPPRVGNLLALFECLQPSMGSWAWGV